MIRKRTVVAQTCAVVLLAARSAGVAQIPTGRPCDQDAFARLALVGASVKSSAVVDAGTAVPGLPAASSELPPFCRVRASATPSAESLVNFEIWIPPAAVWNGKLVVTGNGGYSNAINYRDMANVLQQGYAAAGGDTGHQGETPDDLLWGAGHPERIIDWGTRSIHAIVGPARRIVAAHQAKAVGRTYFYGCSTGGHQGYAEIQRYPDDFDGVIAGAPGNNRVRLNVAFLFQYLANRRSRDDAAPILPAAKLPLVTRAVVDACDANDGVRDGVVDDPRSCGFEPAALRCSGAERADCLTDDQIAALNRLYGGARNPRTGEQVYPGWPKGSEAVTVTAAGAPSSGWHLYWGGAEPARASFWRHWVFGNPAWDWWRFDFDRDLLEADARVGRLIDQTDPDIARFKRRGGKAIVYQGWQDPVVNALDTIAYYERVRARQGSQAETDRFFRLYLVPGMGHCSGGAGATVFGNQNAPAPVAGADYDLLRALDRWVEKGIAPDRIVASRMVDGKVVRTRPLCPYPRKAVFTGKGSADDEANFVCK